MVTMDAVTPAVIFHAAIYDETELTAMEQNLTRGNVWKVLFSFSIPFLIANIIQALYGAVDLMVIGRYCSAESVAAVSTGTQVTQIITSMVSGLSLGGTILAGKYAGMQDEEKTRLTISTTLTLFSIAALILTAFFLLLTNPILRALKTPDASFALAGRYVRVCSAGIFFICGYNAISALLRGCGDSTRPMIFVAISCALNILGDILLVKYAGMGVAGTALATILSQGFSMFAAMWHLNRSRFLFRFRLKNLGIDRRIARELLAVGLPISLQECMVRLSFLYLTSVTNNLGVFAASAVGIASRYDVFAMLPATSAANALAAITAQNFGAGKPARARKSLLAGTCFALSCSLCFFLWAQFSPETMIGLFTSDPSIIRAGVPFFRSCSFDYLAVSFVFCFNGYLNGRSKTVFTMISCCFGAVCLRIPLIYLARALFPDSLFVFGMAAPIVSGLMALYTAVYLFRELKGESAQGV